MSEPSERESVPGAAAEPRASLPSTKSASDDAARVRRLRELFDALVELPIGERDARLRDAAGVDAAMRREVLALLAADGETDARLSSGVIAATSALDEGAASVGARLGPYQLARVVGHGGMGTVYEAVRVDDQYRKRVAVKLVQSGLDSPLALARFRRERQILANLEHRNIATLLDGGVSVDGRPFLVMEYVEGAPITTWCDTHRSTIRERLGLFRQMCAAVQHAHNNLVVHGDLKPGNVFVATDGTVKLLDFGIATLLSPEEDASMPITRSAARALTPEYASPEQLRGDALTTVTDVYSLGVVLFELLAGRRPYTVGSRALIDLERAILESPTPKPSTQATTESAASRGERDLERLRRALAGDLDAIVQRALAPEPSRRYATADALADDVRRYLDGLPVRAQRDWAGYRLAKFVRRNAAAVVASALVVVALIGGVVTTTVQARRARSAQAQAEEVSDFLRTLLSSVKPATGGRDVAVSEVLDSAASRLPTQLQEQPEARAQLERVIADSYLSLGRYDEAERHLRELLALRRAQSRDKAVIVINDIGRIALAKGELDRADSLLRAALALQDSLSRQPDTTRAVIFDNMGTVAHARGDNREAARLHDDALREFTRLLSPNDDRLAISMNNVAVARGELNEWAAAESLHRAVVSIVRRNHPEPATLVADAENTLAGVLDLQGKTLAAESSFVRVLELRKKLLGTEHPDYASTLFSYAMNQMDKPDYPRAIASCQEVLALRGKTVPESHPSIAACLQTMGRAQDKLGDTASARKALEESLALRTKHLPAGSWLLASSESVLGEHYALVKEFGTAERLELHADAVMSKQLGDASPRTQTNLKRLVALYQAWGRPARAAQFAARAAPPGAPAAPK
jgi:serine/threonine-protein kinase